MEHAVLLEARLVDDQGCDEGETDEKGHHDVDIWPRVWVLRPGQAHAEEDEAGSEEEVADPVELLQLLNVREPELCWQRRWVVEDEAEDCRDGVDSSREVPVVSESLRVGAGHGTSNEESHQASQRCRDVIGGLCVWSVLSGQHLGGDCVEERLGTIRDTGNALSRNGHVHGVRARNDNGADGTAEGEEDEKPSAAPVIGCLRDWGREDRGEYGNGRREPGAVRCAADNLCNILCALRNGQWGSLFGVLGLVTYCTCADNVDELRKVDQADCEDREPCLRV